MYDHESEWACVIAANKAMLELRHHGFGPVHINLETNYSREYNVKKIPNVRAIYRYEVSDTFPSIPTGRIAIFVGAHLKWNESLLATVDNFCEKYKAVVLYDHTSNYTGKYGILVNPAGVQKNYFAKFRIMDLLIHIKDITASNFIAKAHSVWRVNPDGELRDPFGTLKCVFECPEEYFFSEYSKRAASDIKTNFYEECKSDCQKVDLTVLELPFSNAWIASQTASKLPANSVLHLGIQNSLRFWNFYETPECVACFSNTGGFGIDGSMSSAIGAALTAPEKIIFCVLGDLAFFYDLNSLGNKNVSKNLRILLVNNGKGTEFKLSGNPGYMFGDETDRFIAAAGHYGNKSSLLVKNYAENLGFEYISASDKEEYLAHLDEFISPSIGERPIVFEVFTNSEDEALTIISTACTDGKVVAKKKVKDVAVGVIGERQ